MLKGGGAMKESKEHYILTLTPEQERIVELALELLARLHIGQFERIAELLVDPRDQENYCQRRDLAHDLLRLAAIVIFGRSACNYPDIKGKSEEHEQAWTIYSVLRYTRSWHENPKGGITVNYDEPLNLAGGPMPKCEIKQEDK